MAFTKFDPRGEREPEQSFIRPQHVSPILVALQLFGIFLTVRLCMVMTGIIFVQIPIIDSFLAMLLSFMK